MEKKTNLVTTNYSFLLYRRMKYTAILAIFIILMFVFYYKDPYKLASTYFGYTTFVTILVGTFLVAIMVWYTYAFTHADQLHITENTPVPVYEYFIKALIFLLGLSVSGALIYWVAYNLNTSTNGIVSFIINILIIIIIFGLIYKIFLSNNYVQTSPIMRLLTQIFFYIPCILVGIVDFIVAIYYAETTRATKSEIVLLLLSILLIVVYLLYIFVLPMIENKFIVQGGKVLLDEPKSLSSQLVLSDYMTLNNIDPTTVDMTGHYDYNYGLSLWVYLDSAIQDLETFIPILDYGGKPTILYNGQTNTLMITESIKDNNDNKIIYTMKDVLLQKWNNIIINYSGGTLDIFYNGELLKSEKNIVPYMSLDTLTVGSNNGLNGGICNVLYFKNALSANQIYYLYNSVKNKTPPTLSK